MNQKLIKLQKIIDIKFKSIGILEQSLIHRSYLNENKSLQLQSNERYEFLGDAILEFWATKNLFSLFPNFTEGDLTNLRSLVVCTQNLAKVANVITLGEFVMLSRGEESHGGRENLSILADTFESLIGAIFLDQGIDMVDKFLIKFVIPSINEISQQKIYKDAKSQFQEIAQSKRGVTPHYITIKEAGPDHQKIFEVAAYVGETLIATGTGNSKQKAEEAAAIASTKVLSN
jgi:ribonuclease-3